VHIATSSKVVGVFSDRRQANRAIEELSEAGFTSRQICVVNCTQESQTAASGDFGPQTHADTGALLGPVVGAGLGGLVGLGIVAGLVPMIDLAIVSGGLITVLVSALVGSGMGGVVGTLVGWGIRKEQGNHYENRPVAVTVQAAGRTDQAQTILNRNGGNYRHAAPADGAPLK
jgi:hypothetical protein